VHFSRDLQRGLRLSKLRREPLVLPPEPLNFDLVGRASLLRLTGQALAGAGVSLLAPLRDVRAAKRPSRRKIAPRASGRLGWESYAAKISVLCSTLNVRRVGLAARSVTRPVWARPSDDAVVMVMDFAFLSRPAGSDNRVPQVPHSTLTDRASPTHSKLSAAEHWVGPGGHSGTTL
jgi:hypothetical protein